MAEAVGAAAAVAPEAEWCGACLSRSRLRRLVPGSDAAALFAQILAAKNYSLPKWICGGCLLCIIKFNNFKEKCRKSHDITLALLNGSALDEKTRMEKLENEREKVLSPRLSLSKMLVLDVTHNERGDDLCAEGFSLHCDDTSGRNLCSDLFPFRESKCEIILPNAVIENDDRGHGMGISLERNKRDDLIGFQVKLEDTDNIYDDFRFNGEGSGEGKSDEDDDDDEMLCEKRKRRSVTGEETTKRSKRPKRQGDSKRKKRKSPKKFIFEAKENISNEKFSSRMKLETEQYKVIKLTREDLIMEKMANAQSERYLNAPYKCNLCIKGFNYEDVLQNHMIKHDPKSGQLECDICHQFLPSAVSMRGHKKSHCTKYQCKKCDVIKASRQHLLEHYMLIHEGAPRTYVCNVCGKALTKRTMFQKHMRIHYPSNKIACDKCGKLFKTIETLRAHMLRHADVKRFSCDQCPKAFRYASLLYTHKVTHITTKNYYCVECDMHFKTQSNLRLHLRKSLKHIDPNSLRFACEQCDKRYEDEKSLRRHIEWVHLRQKNFKCAKCEMQFGSQDGLRSHMKKIHDGIKPPRSHLCEICNKSFRAKAVLIKHIRVHTGERPYECHECGKKFAQNSTMSTHIKLVHLKIQRHVNRKKSTVVHDQNENDDVEKKISSEPPVAVPPPYHWPSEPPASGYHGNVPYYFPSSSGGQMLKHLLVKTELKPLVDPRQGETV